MIIFEENKDKNDFKTINPKSLGYAYVVDGANYYKSVRIKPRVHFADHY
jgi:hypothetical protein